MNKQTIPLMFTWFRIVLIPLLVLVFFSGLEYSNWYTTGIFIAAGISDYLDGMLARNWNVVSEFGAFLDPVADKLMVTSALILVVVLNPSVIYALAAIIIISREIGVSAWREWHAKHSRLKTDVSFASKIKTMMQFLAISFLLTNESISGFDAPLIGSWLLLIAVLLTLYSMAQYLLRQ